MRKAPRSAGPFYSFNLSRPERLLMRASRAGARGHHADDFATAEADVAEQMVVEPQQARIGLPAFRLQEQGGEIRGHFLLVLRWRQVMPVAWDVCMVSPA